MPPKGKVSRRRRRRRRKENIRRGRSCREKEEERNSRAVKTDHMLMPEPKRAKLIKNRRYNLG